MKYIKECAKKVRGGRFCPAAFYDKSCNHYTSHYVAWLEKELTKARSAARSRLTSKCS
jgi:hypothetical protein